MTRKSIKIETTENGYKYFNIYEVKAKKHDGEIITYDRYLTEKEAKEIEDFIDRNMKELYTVAFVREYMVWC